MSKEIKLDALTDAIFEAERFIRKAEYARDRIYNDEYAHFGCREMASAKRASMDLTRALAVVRNPYK